LVADLPVLPLRTFVCLDLVATAFAETD